jgi:REP element-mobilizing transposase RayT
MNNRQSIRLDGYDYAKNGYYFVTIDVQDKLKLFWNNLDIDMKGRTHRSARTLDQENIINQIGKMVDYWWNEIPSHFKNIVIDEYTIMPDHFHGIVVIDNFVGADRCVRPMEIKNDPKLGNIIQWFKTMTTNEYIKNIKLNNWPKFHRRLWQRDYYERIIRNEIELNNVRKYILENPMKWGK